MPRIILVILFCFGFAVFLVMQYGADLVRDIGISGDTLAPHQTARVLNAKCTRYNFVVSACSVDYDDRPSGTMPATKFEATTTLNYLLGGSVAGERVALMRSTAHPTIVTSAVGMDHLANRIFTMLVFLVIFAGTPLIIIVKMATGRLSVGVAAPTAGAPDPQAIDAEIARQLAAQGAPSTRIASTLAPPASAGIAGTFGRRTSFR